MRVLPENLYWCGHPHYRSPALSRLLASGPESEPLDVRLPSPVRCRVIDQRLANLRAALGFLQLA